jgi:hypothetical protein
MNGYDYYYPYNNFLQNDGFYLNQNNPSNNNYKTSIVNQDDTSLLAQYYQQTLNQNNQQLLQQQQNLFQTNILNDYQQNEFLHPYETHQQVNNNGFNNYNNNNPQFSDALHDFNDTRPAQNIVQQPIIGRKTILESPTFTKNEDDIYRCDFEKQFLN